MSSINFDMEFKNDAAENVAVDTDIYCELYDSDGTLRDTLTLTSTPTAIQYNSTEIFYYVANLDVASYSVGNIVVKWYANKDAVNVQPYPYIETITHPDESTTGKSTYTTLVEKLQLLVLEDCEGDALTAPRARTLIELAIDDLNTMKNIKQFDDITLVDDLLSPASDTNNKLIPLILKQAKLFYLVNPSNLVGFTDHNVERRTGDLSTAIRDLKAEIKQDIATLKRVNNASVTGLIERE